MGKTFAKVNDMANVFGGAARLLYATAGTAKPSHISNIFNPTTGVLATGWNDFGATDGGVEISRSYEKSEWEVDQVLGAIDEFITKHAVSITTNLAEASLENISLAWGGSEVSIDGVTGEKSVGIGDLDVMPEYMAAFIVQKRGEKVRAYIFWRTRYSGADSKHGFKKGEKTLIPINFSVLADPTEPQATRFLKVIDE